MFQKNQMIHISVNSFLNYVYDCDILSNAKFYEEKLLVRAWLCSASEAILIIGDNAYYTSDIEVLERLKNTKDKYILLDGGKVNACN